MDKTDGDALRAEIERIAREAGAARVSLAYHDYETGERFGVGDEEWFHAASTIKVAVLLGVFAAVDEGRFDREARVHVRNRFLSMADGRYFRVESVRDAGAFVHAQIGKTMRVRELAKHMIVTSSNLATNLLVDLVGIESLCATLERFDVRGVELRRGVEDESAFEKEINNRVTAAGLLDVLRLIEEGALSPESSAEMLEILHEQEFRSGIPAGVPEDVRVANKTGEISTAAHDAGIVYPNDRPPYALTILTEWETGATSGRRNALRSLSRAVYQHLTRSGA